MIGPSRFWFSDLLLAMRQLCLQLQRHSSRCDFLLWGVVKRVGINDTVVPVEPGGSVGLASFSVLLPVVLVALTSFSVLLPVVLVALASFSVLLPVVLVAFFACASCCCSFGSSVSSGMSNPGLSDSPSL